MKGPVGADTLGARTIRKIDPEEGCFNYKYVTLVDQLTEYIS